MIPQSETERLLGEHLAGAGWLSSGVWSWFRSSSDRKALWPPCAQGGRRTRPAASDWLVGCDGAHSTTRHVLGADFKGKAEPSQWILGDLAFDRLDHSGEIDIFWHEKGVLALFPISKIAVSRDCRPGTPPARSRPATRRSPTCRPRLDERGPGDLRASDPVWIANFRISERKVADYRFGRTFLAGDAAHIHSPAGGQGMNTGMQDAFNLAWKLGLGRRGQAQAEALLASYSLERSPSGRAGLTRGRLATEVATLRNPIGQFLRNHTASILFSFSFVRDKIRDVLGELSINYRHSPLAVEDWSAAAGGKKLHGQGACRRPLARCPVGRSSHGQSRDPVPMTTRRPHTRCCCWLPTAAGGNPVDVAGHCPAGGNFVSRGVVPLLILPTRAG